MYQKSKECHIIFLKEIPLLFMKEIFLILYKEFTFKSKNNEKNQKGNCSNLLEKWILYQLLFDIFAKKIQPLIHHPYIQQYKKFHGLKKFSPWGCFVKPKNVS